MNMCFGARNSDEYRQRKNVQSVDERPSCEPKNASRKASRVFAKPSESVLHVRNNPDESPNRRERLSGAIDSEKCPPTSKKKLWIIDSEGSIDGTFASETNIVRTVSRGLVDVRSGKIVRSKAKSRIVVDGSSSGDKNRGTKDFGVKNSDKFVSEDKKRSTETERFVGDGLSLRMDANERDIEVTGDGCRLTLATNRGRIRMIGDGCRLQIGRNSGDIEYTGDGGRVSLGPDSTGTNVLYVGEGGRVDIADGKIRPGTRGSATSGRTTSSTGAKRVDELSSEILDNTLNERRARRTSKSTCKTVRIVNIDTKIISDGRTNNSARTEKSFTQCA